MIATLVALILAANPMLKAPKPEVAAKHMLILQKRTGVPARVLEAVIYQESRWYPGCRGRADEVGLCQIHPCHNPPKGWTAQMDWAANHLAMLRKRYGNWEVALAAYNGGPGKRHIRRCRRYARRVLRRANGNGSAQN